MIDDGKTELEIADTHFATWTRIYRAIRAYRLLRPLVRSWQTETIVYWGPPGSGKSRHVHELAPDAYWLPKPEGGGTVWFEGYDGQSDVVIDEFYGWITRDLMCRLCDRYPLHVQTKGGAVTFVAKRIFITSNKPPEQWWRRVGLGPMQRRLSGELGYTFFVGTNEIDEFAYLESIGEPDYDGGHEAGIVPALKKRKV